MHARSCCPIACVSFNLLGPAEPRDQKSALMDLLPVARIRPGSSHSALRGVGRPRGGSCSDSHAGAPLGPCCLQLRLAAPPFPRPPFGIQEDAGVDELAWANGQAAFGPSFAVAATGTVLSLASAAFLHLA